MTQPGLTYEVVESRHAVGEWRVEAINYDGDGEIYLAIFCGPDAERRAKEYATWISKAPSDQRVTATAITSTHV